MEALVLGLGPKKKSKGSDEDSEDVAKDDDDEVSDDLLAATKELKSALKNGSDEDAALAFKNMIAACKEDYG